MSQWREIKLKDLCEKVTVGFVGSMAHEYVESGVVFLRSMNIKPFRLDLNDVKFVTEEFHQKIRKSSLRPGDVAVVRTGYPGTAAVIPESLPVSNCSDLVIVRPGKDLNPHFITAIFNSAFGQTLVSGNTVGAAQQHFNITVAKELRFLVPPKPVQDMIAAILSAYDELIETNQWRIALLEKLAEEIYREWFVRLRFPDHQKVKKIKGVPEGWEVRPFSEVVLVNPTERIDRSEQIPFVGMEDLSTTSMFFRSKESRKGGQGSKFRNHDVLFPRITPSVENGKRGYVMTLEDDQVAFGSTEFIVMRKKVIGSEHIYFLTCSPDFRKHTELSMTGASGRQRVQEECFSFFLVKTPPPEIRKRFTEVVSPHFSQIRILSQQNTHLTRTRDLLLPRLISGKLAVEDLEIAFPPGMAEECGGGLQPPCP